MLKYSILILIKHKENVLSKIFESVIVFVILEEYIVKEMLDADIQEAIVISCLKVSRDCICEPNGTIQLVVFNIFDIIELVPDEVFFNFIVVVNLTSTVI